MEKRRRNKLIYIVGAGSIGRALAVCLKCAGKSVILIRSSVDGLPTASETISLNLPDGSQVTENIEVKSFSGLAAIDGIVAIAAKSPANAAIAAKLAAKGTHFPVILLQNGLNVEQPFIEFGFPQVYRCVLFVTSQFAAENTIRFRAVAVCPVGVVKGDFGKLLAAVKLLSSPSFLFKAEQNILQVIWKKVTINCVFNSVCPLLETDNGIFYRNAAALDVAKRVVYECIQVAGLNGVLLTEKEVIETLLEISRSSDGQLISTLQDIRHKRPTEIDTFNLEIARIAGRHGKEDLATETRLLGELTAIKSNLNLDIK
jgi:2-dehydropantoate 2-reductase